MTHEVRVIGNDTEENRILNELMVSPMCTGFVEIGPDNFILPNTYDAKCARDLQYFDVKDEDVYLAAYPKTGSTWLHEVIWLLVNDLDYERTTKERQIIRLPVLEARALCTAENLKKFFNLDTNARERLTVKGRNPLVIKSHLYYSLLPDQIINKSKSPKIIVLLRNPYDVCVSYYHYSKGLFSYKGTFEQFCQLFLAGRVYFGHFWKNVLSYWEQRHRPNILFVKYSDMKKNLPAEIRKIAEFLGKTLTDDDIDKISNFLSFENMKKNPHLNQEELGNLLIKSKFVDDQAVTPFLRSGQDGGYKTVMSPEIIKKFDAWVEEHIAGTGITF